MYLIVSICAFLVCCEERHELIVFNFTRAVLVDLIDELLDVNGHLEFVLHNVYEALSINETSAISVTSE